MQTDVVKAWQIDEGDLITLGGEATFTVDRVDDHGNSVTFHLKDDDGEWGETGFLPDEDVTLVVSLEDDEDIPDIE